MKRVLNRKKRLRRLPTEFKKVSKRSKSHKKRFTSAELDRIEEAYIKRLEAIEDREHNERMMRSVLSSRTYGT